MHPPFALAVSVLLAAVHVAGWRLRALDVVPRSAWLSFAGGTSVAYVFVHLLPEMAHLQGAWSEAALLRGTLRAYHVWLFGLAGLVAFYGVERAVKRSRQSEARMEAEIFWLHMASYGLFNLLVGYLLAWGEGRTPTGHLLFAVAMGLHFLVNDAGLRADHDARYRRVGRWVLAAAVVSGCALGYATTLSELAIGALLGALGGGAVLNVLKEELPDEKESRFWPFVLGAGGYAALLLAVG